MRKIIVIGGGAAGMFAAYASAKKGNAVVLIEKNEKLGKKIYITGKGRCNLTNDVSPANFLNSVVSNPKFLYGSIYSFSPERTERFFEENGLPLKVERGNRVFPASDKASDVTKTLERALKKLNVEILLNTAVESVIAENGVAAGVKTLSGEKIYGDSVIICTGGISYPLTGSTGDGYLFAKNMGHTVISPKPALVGIELLGEEFISLQGLSLKNISVSAEENGRIIYSDFGEMLFTHFGVSGPVILSCSSIINRLETRKIKIFIDLKPALSEDVLDKRLLREFSANPAKGIAGIMRALLPQALVEIIIQRSDIRSSKKGGEITKEERKKLINSLKRFDFSVKKLRPVEEAVVTAGGVSVKELNPKTMESKLVKGIFFAGEVIDVDCFTGGFNLQAAFSTGYAAGTNA